MSSCTVPAEAAGDGGPETAFIGLGANLGDPAFTLRSAREQLEGLGRVSAASSLYLTAPVGGPSGQPPYVNAVIGLQPDAALRDPLLLLAALLDLEQQHGRQRRIRWEARTLDLDLLAYGNRSLNGPELQLPHPRMMERPFVLVPLAEISPHWRHPVTGVSVAAALAGLDVQGVQRLPDRW
jgi:2-amino-4-hydroxy-6-hydroxymethyldihydropteridine diphosphokinase